MLKKSYIYAVKIFSPPDLFHAHICIYFYERVVTSDEPNSKPMFYGESLKQIYCLRKELKENAGLVQDLTTKVHKQESEIHSMKMELVSTRIELGETKDALSDVARKVDILNLRKNAVLNSKQK